MIIFTATVACFVAVAYFQWEICQVMIITSVGTKVRKITSGGGYGMVNGGGGDDHGDSDATMIVPCVHKYLSATTFIFCSVLTSQQFREREK